MTIPSEPCPNPLYWDSLGTQQIPAKEAGVGLGVACASLRQPVPACPSLPAPACASFMGCRIVDMASLRAQDREIWEGYMGILG